MRHARTFTLIAVAGVLLSLSLVTPVGAHVGGTVGHISGTNTCSPLAKGVFYTKTQSNQRYLSPNETTRKFVWRVPNDVDTSLTSDLQRVGPADQRQLHRGEVNAEVDAVTEHGSIVGSFVNNFGEVSAAPEHGLGRLLRRGGAERLRELLRGGWVVHVHHGLRSRRDGHAMSSAAMRNDEGIECLVSGIVHRVP